MTPAERLQRRLAANKKWSKVINPTAATEPARQAFDRRFEDQVDPDHKLPPETRARMAASARKAYFQDLALKSARARRERRAS